MKKTFVIFFILFDSWVLWAQENFPERELQPYRPEELISLNPNVPFNTALEILNGFSQRYENRIIIDSKNRTKPIGVSVERMHWKRALDFILRSNLLKYIQYDRHYEVEDMIDTQEAKPEVDPFDIKTREIEINAVFFQADYEAMQALGINWTTFQNGTVSVQTFGADNVVSDYLRVSANKTFNKTVNVSALLSVIESANKGEVLARPKIRVVDGQKGKIKVGKNFYLTLQDFAGNTRFTEYEAGIILTVTPTLYGRHDSTFIHLDIQAERSDVQPDAIGVTKSITEGRTSVLLLNGEETVLAGLISHEMASVRRGIPLLKDIPLLSYIFAYNLKTVKKKELVIFIEAGIVPRLLDRKASKADLLRYLERQRQEFRDIKSPNRKSGRKGNTAVGRRTSQSRP